MYSDKHAIGSEKQPILKFYCYFNKFYDLPKTPLSQHTKNKKWNGIKWKQNEPLITFVNMYVLCFSELSLTTNDQKDVYSVFKLQVCEQHMLEWKQQ